ncbi:MAG: hydroxymethylglutaryl-CoA synthase [Pseudomonadota bacterium]
MSSIQQSIGISGAAVYLPPYRVDLEAWCDWYDQPWDKIRNVVGTSFRVRGSTENVYTMAASAVVELIERYDVDPGRIRFLALGTESSTDNAAGTVVVKGLVNRALARLGRPPISRYCEVPEFKHACLGGVYGLKNAVRFLAFEPGDPLAIVVSGDVAEYARGSSGEPTQGAGAVAMLVEKNPKLLELRLEAAGSASDDRRVDFRKPIGRMLGEQQRVLGQIRDFPVFNGKYSTTCYLDATLHAVRDMLIRRTRHAAGYLRDLRAAFFHRPYRRMPESGLLLSYLMALSVGSRADRELFRAACETAGVDPEDCAAELKRSPDFTPIIESRQIDEEVYPLAMGALKAFRGTPEAKAMLAQSFGLGAESMGDVGNLYTAALPAWVAAGFEEAAGTGEELVGREVLLMGYGSGDAAEAIPCIVRPEWREAAGRIGMADALAGGIDINRKQYEQLHDSGEADDLPAPVGQRFALAGIGDSESGRFIDFGIEYYDCLVPEPAAAPAQASG